MFSYLPFFYSDVNNPEQMMKYEAVEHFFGLRFRYCLSAALRFQSPPLLQDLVFRQCAKKVYNTFVKCGRDKNGGSRGSTGTMVTVVPSSRWVR